MCLPSLPGALPVFRLSNWKNGRNLLFTESLAEDGGSRALELVFPLLNVTYGKRVTYEFFQLLNLV